jgi:hypothetical protein
MSPAVRKPHTFTAGSSSRATRNWMKGLINGGLWRVETLSGVQKDFIKMTPRSEDESARSAVKVAVLKAFFKGKEGELGFALRRESDGFDYGYALTVHKAQGSQWDDLRLPRASGALALYGSHEGRPEPDGGQERLLLG